jgi:YHS domain-containing protein
MREISPDASFAENTTIQSFDSRTEVVAMSITKRFTLVHGTFLLAVVFGSPAFCPAQDTGAPPWGEFLKRFEKDKLLKKPFHMMPESEVKGLASKIRARELDVPNRKKAIRYLKDLDCTQFPEAKEMLLSLLDPEKEKWEEVRYEAAMGLRDMLERHSCNPNAGKNGKDQKSGKSGRTASSRQSGNGQSTLWEQCCQVAETTGKRVRGERTKAQEPPCHCTSCCDADTLNKLARTAYEMKENGCTYEPSARVRAMAVEAIQACGVPCHYKPYYGEFDEEPGPPAWDESAGRMIHQGEEKPPEPMEESEGVPPAPAPLEPLQTSTPVPVTPISRLTKLCVVSLSRGEQVAPDMNISATYRGRMYYFASVEARQEFQARPERYAVAFGGCDPVHFVQTQQAVEGRFLAEHEGRFFMFVNRENHDAFKANPNRYIPKSSESGRVASSR